MAALPKKAKVVIIGQGGIVGASVVHHLIELGWDDIVGLDKAAIPTDIGSTAHASDFCYMTSHDQMTCSTTIYSRKFFEKMGNYTRIGGIEVARVGDDERMEELKRKVGSGKAFGSNVSMISAREAKEKFPLLEEDMIQGALWDPDAGLVSPRSQTVTGILIENAVATGKLTTFSGTGATGIDVKDGRIRGVQTDKGYIETENVVVCAGIWGPLVAEMAGEKLPMMPVGHPLTFFGPYNEFEGTGKDIGFPLLRDQGNSAYMRDTGDPKTAEGGQIEWGYYEENNPRLVRPKDILEQRDARLSPSMLDLDIEQIMGPLERAMELTPILGELGFDEKHSFDGLLSVTTDGGSLVGESPDTRGLWICEAIWVKDGPGMGKVLAELMTHGKTEFDIAGIDIARFYPIQKSDNYTYERCYESSFKIYNPPVHTREPYDRGRNIRRSPFWVREKELGAHFLEAAGWERAQAYAANEYLLEKYADQVPVRENEWDNRHFWRVANAEQLAMSESVGMINVSHFAIFDVSGRDAEALMEYLSVAKVGDTTPLGKGVYTHFLDEFGGVRSDLTIVRMQEDRFRVMCGGDTGHRDYVWMKRMADNKGYSVFIEERTDHIAALGLWGPDARATLQSIVDKPEELSCENFPYVTTKEISVSGIPIWAFRISYVGEQGWELYVPFSYGITLWDILIDKGVVPVGAETYGNSRRLEKSLRLQNADLLSEYNLYEAGLSRPKVKEANFNGKAAYLEQRELDHQPAYMCTMSMMENIDAKGVARYPIGQWPLIDPATGAVLVDSLGRRSYATSTSYGPSLGKNLILGYLPHEHAKIGNILAMEYFNERYQIIVEAVGCQPLYDPKNVKPKS